VRHSLFISVGTFQGRKTARRPRDRPTSSHPSPDHWGEIAGRLFETSLSVLTLEVYYRYLPLYRTADSEGLEAAAAEPGNKKK
jgi:hypothetical protein